MTPGAVEVSSSPLCRPRTSLDSPDSTNAIPVNLSLFRPAHGGARELRVVSRTREPRRPAPCRGGVRTSILSVVGLLVLAAIVLIVLARSLGPPEDASQRTQARTDRSTASAPPALDVSGVPTITGTISVSPELSGSIPREAALFIIAHKGAGAPFAVQRIVGPRFPLRFRLGPEDVMMAGTPFEGEVRLSARVSRTGSAGPAQPGDLEGERPVAVQVGAIDADFVINRVR